jgi:hypothetical protein
VAAEPSGPNNVSGTATLPNPRSTPPTSGELY